MPITEKMVKLGPGLTLRDAREARALIARDAGLALHQVQVFGVQGNREDMAGIRYIHGDPFAIKHEWPGVRNPGANIIEPITFAVAQDGQRTNIHFPGCPEANRNAEHFLVMGMSGTGKSKTWQTIYAETLNRSEVSVIYVDAAKGIQTVWPLVDGLDWFIDSEAGLSKLIKNLPRVVRGRVDYLGSKGLDEWVPGCGLNYLIVHIEEAGGLLNKRFIMLAERMRSAGISAVASLQRASSDRLNTSVRYNLGGSMCFGCKSVVDARMALMPDTLEGGAVPHLWQNKARGRFYLEHGDDLVRYAMPHQTEWLNLNLVQEEVRSGARYRTPMDELTKGLLGENYALYLRDLARNDLRWQHAMKGETSKSFHIPEDDELGEGILSGDDSDDDDEPEAEAVEGVRAKVIVGRRMPTTQADRTVWDFIESVKESGQQTFTWSEIRDAVLPTVERSETWLNLRLAKLIRNGKLPPKEYTGVYKVP